MRRRLLVFCGTLVLLLLCLEGAVRARQYLRYGTTGRTFHRLALHEESGLSIPAPGTVAGPISVNEHGFRGPAMPREKPPRTVRLAFLGGSTTFCAEVSGDAQTWPALVTSGLSAALPEVAFDGINAGAAGYTTRESVLNLQHRVAPFRPDVIVVYHGTNDLVHEARKLAVAAGRFDPAEVTGDWLSNRWMTFYLLKKNLRFRQRLAHAQDGFESMRIEPGLIRARFEEGLGALVDAAGAEAKLVCLPTFATRLRPEQSEAERAEACASASYYMPFLDPAGILAGYQEINAAIRAVAAARPAVLLVEGEDAIPGDATHFSDSVHFLDPGSHAQAERVLAALLADTRFRALCAERAAEPAPPGQ